MKSNPGKIRTLVLCGDRWHPAKTVRDGLVALGEPGFEFEFIEDGAKWSADMVVDFPVVVVAKANMISAVDETAWLGPEATPAFQDFFRKGGGLLAIHAGISRYENSPLRAAIGGAFLNHPPECPVTLEPHPTHELGRDLETFKVPDEHYFVACEADPCDVFLSSRSGYGVQPAGWTHQEGSGRVCVMTPGHGPGVWQHPVFQQLLKRALHWTAQLALKS